jgi:D-glycero-D-manno-heptose 1,7-bisphosphate phosphatase
MRAGRTRHHLSAVFLDRDGVINRKAPEREYVESWAEFEFLPGALDGARRLAGLGVPILVATNQRGVALGRMTASDVEDIHRRMVDAVSRAGGRIDGIYVCPHEAGCRCRKPRVGMFEAAARDHGIALERAALIGDSPSDMLAARRIGALRISVGALPELDADYHAADLAQAASWLLEGSGR